MCFSKKRRNFAAKFIKRNNEKTNYDDAGSGYELHNVGKGKAKDGR